MTPLFIFPKEMPKLTRILWILVFPVSAIITITIILSILLKSHNSAPPQPLPNVSSSKERATAVRDTFQFAWNGYANYAFPHDELHPVDNAPGTSRNDWGATAIDALGTAILMEIPEVVQMILDFVPSIDFNYTKTRISLFETNIRYLGGMISAYDLLSGPFVGLISNATAKDALLVQSKRLADFLSIAFDTPTGIPENLLHFDGIHIVERRNVSSIADVGTLILEWTRLSDLLHDPKYTKLAQKAEDYTFDPQPAFGEPFPGLIMDQMNTTTGESIQSDGGWGGSSDSYYEYLLKAFIYNETRFSQYKVRWILAANSTMKHLASHPSSRPDLTFLSRYRGPNLTYLSGHSM
jgi:mannosyl-oligosaccharide alpha-1,2-mannosidase